MNLNQITILSTDVNTSVDFYKKLGLELIVDSAPRYVRFQCPEGDSTFSIHHIDALTHHSPITLYFEHEHLDTWVNDLQSKGIIFEELPTDQPWLWREARLKDPDGHQLILYYAGNNRKDPPWKVNTP